MIICPECNEQFKPVRIGITLIEYQESELETPYRLWQSDKLMCKCGNTVYRTACRPSKELFHPGFCDEANKALENPDTIKFY